MRATMLLCDAAQEVGGKLYILGAGWTNLVADTPASIALAIVLHFDWDEANRRQTIELELETYEGEVYEGEDGNPVRLSTGVEVGRPPGMKPGSEINAALALSLHGISLPAGGYVWILRSRQVQLGRAPFSVGERQ